MAMKDPIVVVLQYQRSTVLQLPFARVKSLRPSAEGSWREDRVTIDPSADDQPGAIIIRSMHSLRNNVVLEIADQGGAP